MAESVLRGTSSSERTLDAQELAALRPAVQRAPSPRKVERRGEVTSGMVCFCGERFGQSEAIEFMLHVRAEVGERVATLERRRDRSRAANARYRQQPEAQERRNEYFREYHQRPEVKLREQERERGRAAYRAARKRERRANDPEYRERVNAQLRAWRAAQPQGARARMS